MVSDGERCADSTRLDRYSQIQWETDHHGREDLVVALDADDEYDLLIFDGWGSNLYYRARLPDGTISEARRVVYDKVSY